LRLAKSSLSLTNNDDDDDYTVESIALIIAHPDDEAMFFTPTLDTLQRHQTNQKQTYDIHLICLSNGNFRGLLRSCFNVNHYALYTYMTGVGLGKIREKELMDSCRSFNIAPANCHIIDHKQLQDGSEKAWSQSTIATIVKPLLKSLKISKVN
jgi:N-acetylglucosaminylphosphatidylinositol deacetylase